MITQTRVTNGYLLLPVDENISYRGVDRQPFEPAILPDEINLQTNFLNNTSHIWILYPPGWRQEAYKLYEENSINVDDLYLLTELTVARKIEQIIKSHIGLHEIVKCQVWDSEAMPQIEVAMENGFLGYDIAYPGGDYFSAVLNGLIVNPHPVLVEEFDHLLNRFSLFINIKMITRYLHRFKELVPSETNSKFSVFHLTLIGT